MPAAMMDAAEPLDVDVDQLTRMRSLVALRGLQRRGKPRAQARAQSTHPCMVEPPPITFQHHELSANWRTLLGTSALRRRRNSGWPAAAERSGSLEKASDVGGTPGSSRKRQGGRSVLGNLQAGTNYLTSAKAVPPKWAVSVQRLQRERVGSSLLRVRKPSPSRAGPRTGTGSHDSAGVRG